MKKKVLIVLPMLIVFVVGMASTFYVKKNNIGKNTTKELINISKLSEEFMDNYFDDVKELNKEGNLENVLIVISKRDVNDGYGAKKVIKAPNNQYILQYDTKELKDKAMEELKNDSYVLSVNENGKYELYNDNNNEPSNYNSWGIEVMGLDTITSGLDASKLENVTVAILDTGLNVELFNKYFNGRLQEVKNIAGDEMTDEVGHGTHIAGTIAEGTLSNVSIIPVKISSASSIDDVNIVAAINWVTYNHKADVMNMSFGGYTNNEATYQAIEAAEENNIISVTAAGNENTSYQSYPASYDNTISIASIDSFLNRSEFSNYGDTISFATPGSAIKSIMSSDTEIALDAIYNDRYDNDDDFETISGTSMATPHAVCAVALLKSMNKELSFDAVMTLLEAHSLDLGEEGWDPYFGYGLINFSSAEFCDGQDCDEYNIFKNTSAPSFTRIDAGEDTYEAMYNYGSEMNILEMPIKIYYTEKNYILRDLGDLEDYTIENFNPDTEGTQEVTIEYKGLETTKTVNNHLTDGWVWEYSYESGKENKIILNKMLPEGTFKKYVIVPEEFNGIPIIEMNNMLFKDINTGENNFTKTIKVLANIPELPHGAFNGCQNLESVELPDTITAIPAYAFCVTPKLKSFVISERITEIGEYAFQGSGLETVTIPGSIKTISNNAFQWNNYLREVIISEGVETIEDNAFSNNSALTTISIPKTVTEIGTNVFGYDASLKNIDLDEENEVYENEEGSNTIVEKATNTLVFATEYSTIPEDVHILGPYSVNASWFKIPDQITRIKDYALNNTYLTYFPTSIETIDSPLAVRSNIVEEGPPDEVGVDHQVRLVHKNSYTYNYLVENEIMYNIIDDPEIVIVSETEFEAYDTVDDSIEQIYFVLDGDTERYYNLYHWMFMPKNFTITYMNNQDSLRYGDEYFTVNFEDLFLGNQYSKKVYVTVSKATPKYTVPTGLSVDQGQALSTITLPSGFSWNEPDTIAEEAGTQTFLATYTPQDTDNYKIVDDVEIEVTVNKVKQIINPNITISDKTFDGTNEVSTNSVSVSNLEAGEYTIISIASDNINVGEATATVTLRLTNEKFEDYTFADGLQEKEFSVNYNILKAIHVITFHANNDTEETTTQEMETATDTALKKNTFEKTDYLFKEWNTQADGKGTSYKDEQVISVTSNLDLYAIWDNYVINNYSSDSANKIIYKIKEKTKVNTFTSNFTLGTGYGVDVDTVEVDGEEYIYTGGKTRITHGLELFEEFTNVVTGDPMGDGVIDSGDILAIRLHLLNTETLENEFFMAADIDEDEDLSSADILAIRLHILGIEPIE